MRRYLSVAFAAAVLVTACGTTGAPSSVPATSAPASSAGASTAPEPPTPSTPAAPTKLTVGLHWSYHVADWMGAVLADKKGYYEAEGLEVEFQFLGGSNPVVKAVGAGSANIGLAGADAILSGMSQGLPVVAVANHLQTTTSGVVAPETAGIATFADLKGKTIASAAASPELALLRVKLHDAGLDIDKDVKIVLVDPQTKCTVVLAKQADACTGQSNFHPQQFEAQGVKSVYIGFSTDDQPVIGATTIANKQFLESSPDVVKAFLRATYKGWVDAVKDSNESIVGLFTADRPETDPEQLKKTIDVTRDTLLFSERTDANGWGWMEDASWKTLDDALAAAGVIKAPVPLADIYTTDYLPEPRDFPRP